MPNFFFNIFLIFFSFSLIKILFGYYLFIIYLIVYLFVYCIKFNRFLKDGESENLKSMYMRGLY